MNVSGCSFSCVSLCNGVYIRKQSSNAARLSMEARRRIIMLYWKGYSVLEIFQRLQKREHLHQSTVGILFILQGPLTTLLSQINRNEYEHVLCTSVYNNKQLVLGLDVLNSAESCCSQQM